MRCRVSHLVFDIPVTLEVPVSEVRGEWDELSGVYVADISRVVLLKALLNTCAGRRDVTFWLHSIAEENA